MSNSAARKNRSPGAKRIEVVLCRAHPPLFPGRLLDRLHQGLDALPGTKIERLGSRSNRVNEARDLNRLQIVETELMARRDAEEAIGIVLRPRFDTAEAAPAGGIGGAVETQLVEALLAKDERSLGAIDLEIVLHLAPSRDPAGFDAARSPVSKAHESAADIIDLDPARGARSVRAGCDRGDAIAQDTLQRTEQKLSGGERVTAQIRQCSTTDRIVTKCERTLRVRHIVFGMNTAITADVADFAAVDQIAREGDHRIAEIVEADLRGDASSFSRVGHLAGV